MFSEGFRKGMVSWSSNLIATAVNHTMQSLLQTLELRWKQVRLDFAPTTHVRGLFWVLLLWLQSWGNTPLFSCWHWPSVLTFLAPPLPKLHFVFGLPNWIHQVIWSSHEVGCPVPNRHSSFHPPLLHLDSLLTVQKNHALHCRSSLKLLMWHCWVYIPRFTQLLLHLWLTSLPCQSAGLIVNGRNFCN